MDIVCVQGKGGAGHEGKNITHFREKEEGVERTTRTVLQGRREKVIEKNGVNTRDKKETLHAREKYKRNAGVKKGDSTRTGRL